MRAFDSATAAIFTYARPGRIIVVLEGHRTIVPATGAEVEDHAAAALRVAAEAWGHDDGHLVGAVVPGGFAWALCEGPEPDLEPAAET